MDFAATITSLEALSKKRSTFVDGPGGPTPAPPAKAGITFTSVISFVIGVVIGLVAIYLSWTCNTAIGHSTLAKVIFAFFAWLFGFMYLLFYVILRWDVCAYAKRNPNLR